MSKEKLAENSQNDALNIETTENEYVFIYSEFYIHFYNHSSCYSSFDSKKESYLSKDKEESVSYKANLNKTDILPKMK